MYPHKNWFIDLVEVQQGSVLLGNDQVCNIRFSDSELVSYAFNIVKQLSFDEPRTYKEAMSSKDNIEWLNAMQEEVISLEQIKTWTLIDRPCNAKVISCKWVYKRKIETSVTGDKVRFKARLVARGFSQTPGIDYNEVFSPVVKHTSVRVLLSVVAQNDMFLEQLDVKTAFLHDKLEETIYMSQPEGFAHPKNIHKVCLLNKSLYGLKQSPRQWYKRFDEYMVKLGFDRSRYDNCVYV